MNNRNEPRRSFWFAAISFWMLSLVFLLLILKVAPVLSDIYAGFGAPLPALTLGVLQISTLLRHLFVLTVPFTLLVMAGGGFLMSRTKGNAIIIIYPLSVFIVIVLVVVALFLPMLKLSGGGD
jgi:hypothetical protein